MARQNKAEIVLTARDLTKSAFRAVNQNLGRFAAIGVAGAAAGLALLTRAGLKEIDALAKQSQLLGITTEKLAAFKLVAAKTGIEQKTLEKSLINVTRVAAEAAEGTGLAVDTLKKLNLEARALARQSPDEQFQSIAEAMKGLNTQSEKVLAAYELFGGRGAALLRTLEAGNVAFEEAEERTRKFGTAISAIDAKGVEDANDAFTDLQESVKGVGFDLARRFAPGMEAASISTANFLVTLRRDVIPAFALLLEQLDLVTANVRGLTDIELAVRIESGAEDLANILEKREELENSARVRRLEAIGKENKALRTLAGELGVNIARDRLEQDRAAAETRLEEVKAEQQRRAEIILEADRKLDEMRAAQAEEARIIAAEKQKEVEREAFEERFELESERVSEFIKLQFKRADETRRIRFREARVEQRAMVAQGRLEARAAQNTIRLKQATAQASIQILTTLVGKNKTVARALFLVEKGLAIARTIQNTAAASVKALAELGPIAGPPAAAAIQAFGAAQIGLIAATALTGVGAIGGAGGAGGIAIGGGGSTTDFGTTADFGGGEDFGGGGTPTRDQGVVQLIFPSLFGITPEAIDALADALREASENRDVIIVAGSGRNAELLTGTNG